ncbi:alpha/beta fold hydrolase [Streptomyces sp. ISL-98]|nr:alpha/beta fold hydrolase [Streptomyces sp. ISL-98]
MGSEAEGQNRRSIVPLITRRPRRTTLRTDDGVRIEALYEPWDGTPGGLSGGATGELAIVVAHGFTGSVDRPAVRRAARVFTQYAAVITFSFRGHGGSGGRSTVGDREVLDLAAAVRWARSLGYARVVTVGFSMGGSVALRHAALYGNGPGVHGGRTEARTAMAVSSSAPAHTDAVVASSGPAHTDAVVAVSAPARWYYRGTAPMRRLHWVVTRPVGRLVGRFGFRTRIHRREWDPVPLSPVEAVARIASATPLLIVHGDRDPYFPLDHPRMLAAAAAGTSGLHELWIEPGMGHAENAAHETLLTRIAAWLAGVTAA